MAVNAGRSHDNKHEHDKCNQITMILPQTQSWSKYLFKIISDAAKDSLPVFHNRSAPAQIQVFNFLLHAHQLEKPYIFPAK